ncbi:B-box zinc finger protein 32 [Curcuma longa]|uniref:B-box zinc finger protein 32 n=1 Tax=Curcuma longa TaxID=136217 RepID=UPI003D9F1EDD
MKQKTACELCSGEAAVYCEADEAFLCWACDASVHGANFLVARHLRRVACASCDALGPACCVSGRVRRICSSCFPDQDHSDASSSCLSTSESAAAGPPPRRVATAAKRPLGEAEAILLGWSRRMGLRGGRRCAEVAARVVAACGRTAAAQPLRVVLAAALWSSIKRFEIEAAYVESRGGAAALRRLEACSGVPARLILAAESRIARRVRVADAEEGWAECP